MITVVRLARANNQQQIQRLENVLRKIWKQQQKQHNPWDGKLRGTAAYRLGLVGGVVCAITTNNRNLDIFMRRPW